MSRVARRPPPNPIGTREWDRCVSVRIDAPVDDVITESRTFIVTEDQLREFGHRGFADYARALAEHAARIGLEVIDWSIDTWSIDTAGSPALDPSVSDSYRDPFVAHIHLRCYATTQESAIASAVAAHEVHEAFLAGRRSVVRREFPSEPPRDLLARFRPVRKPDPEPEEPRPRRGISLGGLK